MRLLRQFCVMLASVLLASLAIKAGLHPAAAWFLGFMAGCIVVDLEPRRVRTTAGNPKWSAGHCVGCVLNAPADECICDKVMAQYEAKYTSPPPSKVKGT